MRTRYGTPPWTMKATTDNNISLSLQFCHDKSVRYQELEEHEDKTYCRVL